MRRLPVLSILVALSLMTAISPAVADPGDNAVGLNIHHGPPDFIAAAADANVSWVRMDGNWFQMEPSSGNYDWILDSSVTNAHNAGLNVFITLAYTPAWVSRSGDTDGISHNDVPDSAAWSSFVRAAVTHYRAMGVTHFGIWNEANLQHFYEADANSYVNTIAVPGAAAVRAVCNDCMVLGPDLAHVGDADDFLDAVLTAAPAGTFDIITHHSYNGFPELGTQIWDGDRYFEVLDQQRFQGITRRSLRQILDENGYTGEVWMTETGYRAQVDDAADEQKQATYITLVLDEQLKRDWVTNTFIYEIHDCGPDQPMCTIDGFGLVRGSGTLPRTWPTDYRRKPAYDALANYIDTHTEFDTTPPTTECSDNLDNDGDGAIDLEDPACTFPSDGDESADPARTTVQALQGPATVDGDLSEYARWHDVPLANWNGNEPLIIPGDLIARVAARWDADNLYLAIDVLDDTHQNTHQPANIWQGDSVQLAFDVGGNGGLAYDDDDHEINVALAGGSVVVYRFHGPVGVVDDIEAQVVHAQGMTAYEIRIARSSLPGAEFVLGSALRFSFLVNEDDGGGRLGWLEFTPGIGQGKAPLYFGEIAFADADSPPLEDFGGDMVGNDMAVGSDVSGPDAGDSNTGTDVSDGLDSGMEANAPGGGGAGDEGCGCQVTARDETSPRTLALVLLVGLLVAVMRRR